MSQTWSNRLTSLERRLTIWPVVVFPMAALLRHRACKETGTITDAALTTKIHTCVSLGGNKWGDKWCKNDRGGIWQKVWAKARLHDWPSCRSCDTWPLWSSCPPSGHGRSRGDGAKPGRWHIKTGQLRSPESHTELSCHLCRNFQNMLLSSPTGPAGPP